MTLHATLGRTSRAGLCSARTAASLAQGGGSCSARGPVPACAPCVPAPPPPCRELSPAVRPGLRVVCCAPAPGTPPPCPCAPPSCPLTCQNANHDQNCVTSNQAYIHSPEIQPNWYSCDQDPVARRLELARSVRRAHYEWQVAWRAYMRPTHFSCPAPYVLRRERKCARATDGCTYTVVNDPSARLDFERCGPCRTPPPPHCVELAPDDACRIKSNEHLDPCAHRPRIILEIDRSYSSSSPSAPTCVLSSPCAPSCHLPSACTPCGGAPPCCRQPTIVEILRARHFACQSNRHTHTSAALFKTVTPTSGRLEDMLRSKEQLKEAGLGRVVTDLEAGPVSPSETLGGLLELSVPPGAERVVVRVSLTGPESNSTTTSCSASRESKTSVSGTNLDATCVTQNPWLPIKKIPKKWTSSIDLKAGAQFAGARYPNPCSPCGPPTLPRCKPGPVQSPNELNNETKRCSSTAAFMTNTII